MNRNEFQELAQTCGVDLVGVTTCERLESKVPESARPSQISDDLSTFVVLAKRIPVGVAGARDGDAKQLTGSLLHRVLEEGAGELAYALEARDYMAVVLPSLIMDFKSRDELSNTPAGQGSLYLRLAAVEAGMGTLGLNNMLLTPEFGPRVYLCGMMTNLALGPDTPLDEELCLGLADCGRCAAICPAGRNPTGGSGRYAAGRRPEAGPTCMCAVRAAPRSRRVHRLFQGPAAIKRPDSGQYIRFS